MGETAGKRSNALIYVAAFVVVVYGMQAAKVLLVPFLLASFIGLMTIRPMLWLQSKRVPAMVAALIIVTTIVLVLTILMTIVGTSLAEFTRALPSYQARLDLIVKGFFEFLAERLDDDYAIEGLRDIIDPGWAMNVVATTLNAVREIFTNVLLIVLTIVFILLEASSLPTKISVALGTDSFASRETFLDNLGRYLGIKTLVSMMTGVCAGLLTWAIGLDFPLLWAMVAFLMNFIPTIGSILAAIPAVLLAVVQLGFGAAFGTLIGYLVINVAFGNLLEPRMMGRGVGISPLIVFIGIFFWGWVFGPVGMLLSVPLTMSVKMSLEGDDRTRWVAILLGSERDAEYALEKQR
ncbi:MAG: AI-2E family transporter [Gammaproteobacteria bacterium]